MQQLLQGKPVSGIGTFNIIGVDRAALGTLAASHNNSTSGRVFSGSFNIKNLMYSLQTHQEEQIILKEIYQILKHQDLFSKVEHILEKLILIIESLMIFQQNLLVLVQHLE